MSANVDLNDRPEPDKVLTDIADYVIDYDVTSEEAYNTARYCLMDTLACGIMALKFPACVKMLGHIVPGTVVPGGVRVPGRPDVLDPVKGAFDIGCMIRWLDFNDTWLAAEWGHPSDNLGAILSTAQYVGALREKKSLPPITVHDVLTAMIKAHEIQGCFALENSFNKRGIDHVVLVKVASTALAMQMLGGTHSQIVDALSHAFVDGQALRTYRHAPNAGPRKSWAAGDATSRAVRLAMIVQSGEIGYPSVLTTSKWGFYDVLFDGKPFHFQRPYGSYVMEQILFKISYPAEFHSQTAVECAVRLHPQIKDRLDDIDKIILTTHESAIRIISKTGKLNNPADRDHCLQYMVAVALMTGNLVAENYEDDFANDPVIGHRIDTLRRKMQVIEDERYSIDYHAPDKRSIANAIQIVFRDGTATDKIGIEYPIGHRRRRAEGIPVLEAKFESALKTHYSPEQADRIISMFKDHKKLDAMCVREFMEAWV